MSGILKRIAFINNIPFEPGHKRGPTVCRFGDVAHVITGVGSMLEPFTLNEVRGITSDIPVSYDPKDMIRRVDEIRAGTDEVFFNVPTVLHSYEQWMRVGP